MIKINMHEAKSRLSELAEYARKGQKVLIHRNGEPWVELIPYTPPKRKPGRLKGKIVLAPDFDTENELIADWFEGKS